MPRSLQFAGDWAELVGKHRVMVGGKWYVVTVSTRRIFYPYEDTVVDVYAEQVDKSDPEYRQIKSELGDEFVTDVLRSTPEVESAFMEAMRKSAARAAIKRRGKTGSAGMGAKRGHQVGPLFIQQVESYRGHDVDTYPSKGKWYSVVDGRIMFESGGYATAALAKTAGRMIVDEQLVPDTVPGPASPALEQHLESCPTCVERRSGPKCEFPGQWPCEIAKQLYKEQGGTGMANIGAMYVVTVPARGQRGTRGYRPKVYVKRFGQGAVGGVSWTADIMAAQRWGTADDAAAIASNLNAQHNYGATVAVTHASGMGG